MTIAAKILVLVYLFCFSFERGDGPCRISFQRFSEELAVGLHNHVC